MIRKQVNRLNTINKLNKATEIFTTVFAWIAGAALLFNVIIIVANVILRSTGTLWSV